ncbi:hypothetical protein CEXT_219311 [Caerostris extrusa]|uniref:Uncharacterized protein n=1 Tax=Caerostris extrusa TaxID=172846 RepID=A0AAV4QKW5_CAEEX|nr:hypothetical protein CEXT_219311 [Caerostris extrusa]
MKGFSTATGKRTNFFLPIFVSLHQRISTSCHPIHKRAFRIISDPFIKLRVFFVAAFSLQSVTSCRSSFPILMHPSTSHRSSEMPEVVSFQFSSNE